MQVIYLFMAALCNRAGHYIFALWFLLSSTFLPAALRAAQNCRYLIYSEADFEVFRPAGPIGATRCTDGGEIWHGGGDVLYVLLIRAIFLEVWELERYDTAEVTFKVSQCHCYWCCS